MSVASLLHYTVEDYLTWEGDWELIQGMPVAMSPAPARRHQQVAAAIFMALNEGLQAHCSDCELLYETDWKIAEDTLVRPDIVLACGDTGESYLSKTPGVVVELVSPSSAKKDEIIKFELYQFEGVQYYLLVYPDELKAKIYTLRKGKYQKLGDFTMECFAFDKLPCSLSIDFGKAFARFR